MTFWKCLFVGFLLAIGFATISCVVANADMVWEWMLDCLCIVFSEDIAYIIRQMILWVLGATIIFTFLLYMIVVANS